MNHKWIDPEDLDPGVYDRAEIKRQRDERDRNSKRAKRIREKRKRDTGLRQHRPREQDEG